MSDIFICYSRNDLEIASHFRELFKAQGWNVFMDTHIKAGQRYRRIIEQELDTARAIVALWSSTSRESDYVIEEAEEGKKRGVLVPAFIENVRAPYGFGLIQTANLVGWGGSSNHSELQHPFLSALRALLEESNSSKLETPYSITNITPPPKPIAGTHFKNTLKNGIEGPEMVIIPPGSFLMGSDDGHSDEQPQHKVTIDTPFAMGRYPVTFAEYDLFVKAEGRELPEDRGWGRENRPVINVSWDDVIAYCEWLSNQTDRHYRLPSEAEWEYAARAGTTTRYWWGDEVGQNHANFDGSGSQWSNQQTSPVGSFEANPFGLHDVHGNVWEWCQDLWHKDYQGAPEDGSVWLSGKEGTRVLRGGSWSSYPVYARAAYRNYDTSDLRLYIFGFRLCCSPPIK